MQCMIFCKIPQENRAELGNAKIQLFKLFNPAVRLLHRVSLLVTFFFRVGCYFRGDRYSQGSIERWNVTFGKPYFFGDNVTFGFLRYFEITISNCFVRYRFSVNFHFFYQVPGIFVDMDFDLTWVFAGQNTTISQNKHIWFVTF